MERCNSNDRPEMVNKLSGRCPNKEQCRKIILSSNERTLTARGGSHPSRGGLGEDWILTDLFLWMAYMDLISISIGALGSNVKSFWRWLRSKPKYIVNRTL